MNSDYVIKRIMSTEDALYMKNKLITDGEWIDGLKSTVGISKDVKKNNELHPKSCEKQRAEILEYYKKNRGVIEFTNAYKLSTPIVSKTAIGEHYHTHIDQPENGHYSTTLFLSDPEEYEGGNLILYLSGGIKKVKLKPGQAIVYRTGIPHCVETVTSGTRLVSVFWITSSISTERDRQLLWKTKCLAESLKEKYPDFNEQKCEPDINKFLKDPAFILRCIQSDIVKESSTLIGK